MTNESVAVYIRVFGWFFLLQAWCTLRFDDHRGLEPASIRDSTEAFSAVLTRSKTHVPHRGPERKVVYMDKACWLHEPSWFDVGYQRLMRLAPYERDYLLPSPGPNYGGIRQAELSYDGALAALGRLLRTLQSEDKELLIPHLCSYWTPHSPRSFLPTCCAALGVSKPGRDVLGRWAKQGSDRYVRISRMIIQRLQLLAAHTLRGRPDAAALIGEAESLSELQEFLRERGLPQDQIDQQTWRLNSEFSRKFSVQVKPKHELFTPNEEQERMLREEVLFHQSEVVDEPQQQNQSGLQAEHLAQPSRNSGSKHFRSYPKVSTSAQQDVGRSSGCISFTSAGWFRVWTTLPTAMQAKSMPPQTDFDEVCKMCSVRKEHQPNNASDSESDPSTDDVP